VTAQTVEFQTAYFWQFLRRFLAHPVVNIAKSRQFLDNVCTVVQGEFSAGIALPFFGDAIFF